MPGAKWTPRDLQSFDLLLPVHFLWLQVYSVKKKKKRITPNFPTDNLKDFLATSTFSICLQLLAPPSVMPLGL